MLLVANGCGRASLTDICKSLTIDISEWAQVYKSIKGVITSNTSITIIYFKCNIPVTCDAMQVPMHTSLFFIFIFLSKLNFLEFKVLSLLRN